MDFQTMKDHPSSDEVNSLGTRLRIYWFPILIWDSKILYFLSFFRSCLCVRSVLCEKFKVFGKVWLEHENTTSRASLFIHALRWLKVSSSSMSIENPRRTLYHFQTYISLETRYQIRIQGPPSSFSSKPQESTSHLVLSRHSREGLKRGGFLEPLRSGINRGVGELHGYFAWCVYFRLSRS